MTRIVKKAGSLPLCIACIIMHGLAGAASRSKVLCLGRLERSGLPQEGVKKMFRMHRERGSGGERFSVAGASVSETQDKKTLTLALSQGERGWSRRSDEECPDRQWVYRELVRIKRRSIEMSLGSYFAAKDCGDSSPRGGRNEDLEKLYQKRPIWGGTAIRNGRRFPKGRGDGDVNQKWSRESNLRRLESTKQMYT